MGKPKNRSKNLATKSRTTKLVQMKSQHRPKHRWSQTRQMKIKKSKPEEIEGIQVSDDEERVLDVAGKSKKNKRKEAPSHSMSASKEPLKKESLREKMIKRLEAARFRQVNEELDSSSKNSDPAQAFLGDPEQFKKYHDAYRQRVEHWPKNPLHAIIRWAKKKLKGDKIIADFGCGEAELAASIPNKVHSFDLFALNERVTVCDMSKVPLQDNSIDAAVFCLSLMGTDVSKFIGEANRVLKTNGLLKIAEVSSRFSGNSYNNFLKRMTKFGFIAIQKGQGQKQMSKDESVQNQEDVFLMLEFKKIKSVKAVLGRLPALKLNPSVYKKR